MATLSPVSTSIAQTSAAPQALSGAKTGIFSGGGLSGTFFDLILALGTPADGTTPNKQGEIVLTPETLLTPPEDNSGETDEIDLLLESLGDFEGAEGDLLATAMPDITAEATDGELSLSLPIEKPLSLQELALLLKTQDEAMPVEFEAFRAERLQKKIDAAQSLLDRLTNGLPEDMKGKPFVEFFITRLEHRIETLQARLEDLQDGSSGNLQALIALGLTPGQITSALKRIDAAEKKLGRQLTPEDLIAGVAGIVPVSHPLITKPAADSIPSAATVPFIPDNAEPTDDLARRLNDINVESGQKTKSPVVSPGLPKTDADAGVTFEGSEYKNNIQAAGQRAGRTNPDQPGYQTNTAAQAHKSAMTPLSATVTGMSASLQAGDIVFPNISKLTSDHALHTVGFDVHTGLPLSIAGQAAHATTSLTSAGQAHPATHMVAAQITKSAREGKASVITLELDPPELGRVDVKLEFGNDQTVKALLTVEKPETHQMLQRDAAYLERALHSAGLTVDGGGINFQLASDPGSFGQFTDDAPNGGNGGTGKDKAEDVIATTMTWQVDSETGHVRYNILA